MKFTILDSNFDLLELVGKGIFELPPPPRLWLIECLQEIPEPSPCGVFGCQKKAWGTKIPSERKEKKTVGKGWKVVEAAATTTTTTTMTTNNNNNNNQKPTRTTTKNQHEQRPTPTKSFRNSREVNFQMSLASRTHMVPAHIVNILLQPTTTSTYQIVYVYIPGTYLSSIFELQPSKTRPFPNQNKGHLGSRYVCIYIYILPTFISTNTKSSIFTKAFSSLARFSDLFFTTWEVATSPQGRAWWIRMTCLLINVDPSNCEEKSSRDKQGEVDGLYSYTVIPLPKTYFCKKTMEMFFAKVQIFLIFTVQVIPEPWRDGFISNIILLMTEILHWW